MLDEPREYLRAAQAAEVRGDRAQAADLLFKAAHLYRANGKDARALALLRHAQKMDPSRKDLADEIRRLEWLPDQPMRRALAPHETLEEEMRNALAPLEDADSGEVRIPEHELTLDGGPLPGDGGRPLVDRGPTLADPAAAAWCSFCCKPARDVGALVAGPAGAFVCAGCVTESARLLGRAESALAGASPLHAVEAGTVAKVLKFAREPEGPPPGTALEVLTQKLEQDAAAQLNEPTPVPAPTAAAPAPLDLPNQTAARRELDQALNWGRRRILVLGPIGAGKSTVIKAAADAKRGFLFGPSSAPRSVPEDWLIALDDAQPTTPEGWQRAKSLWERHGGVAVMALRGRAPAASAEVLTEDARLALPGTSAIVDATDGALPVEIAEKVDAVIVLAALDDAGLGVLATSLLASRGFADSFAAEAVPHLTLAARSSGRGAHELLALVSRIPPGAWKLELGPSPDVAKKAPTSKRRGKRKGDLPP